MPSQKKHWFADHFLRHATGARPLLLLMDGHSSHYQPEIIRLARENDVVILCFLPHTSADSQPLDVFFFRSLKTEWGKVCHDWINKHPGRVITKFQFSELLHKAWTKSMTPANAVAGFRKAGVYPFNRNKITVPTTTASKSKTATKSPAKDAKANSVTTARLPTPPLTVTSASLPTPPPPPPPPRTVVFTEEQVAMFELRLEEGYDLPDPEYLQWLELNHPDALPSDRYDLTLNEPTSSATPGLLSVVEEFLTVTPLLPASTSSSETSPSTSAMSQTGTIPSTPSTSESVTNSAMHTLHLSK